LNKAAKSRLRAGWLLTAAVIALTICSPWKSAGAQAQNREPMLHKPAPPIERTALDGRPFALAKLRGKVVLLNFWATWCAPCQIETPRFVSWQKRYAAQGLQVVGVSMDDEAGPVRAAAKRLGVNYPVVMGDEKLGEAYGGVLGLPLTFLIGRDGKIAAVYRGETDLKRIEADLRRLLAQR
jgi:cytochrome c biogenesis protein CcmG/thiol:disulfide interchange protein DsbE